MTAYYNEFDPKAAAWLRQLITNGDIAPGEVDERSIIDVEAADLTGFSQHHFFAGIGVWSYSLRNAGWSDDRPVTTASLPCQPFSAAGNQKGKDDERHLLPHFLELVGQCNFHTIIGEQVPGAIKHGWLDDLHDEMERENYTVGSVVLTAAGSGKPHIRKRIYWVAHSNSLGQSRQGIVGRPLHSTPGEDREIHRVVDDGIGSVIDWLYCRDQKYRPIKSGLEPLVDGIARSMVHSSDTVDPNNSAEARTIRLKGYGNAIVAPVAEAFIRATMEVIDGVETL